MIAQIWWKSFFFREKKFWSKIGDYICQFYMIRPKNQCMWKAFHSKQVYFALTKKFYELSPQKYHNVSCACEEILLKQTNLQKKKEN